MTEAALIRILGAATAAARRTTDANYHMGATETLDNLLYPLAAALGRTVEGLRQDVNRAAV